MLDAVNINTSYRYVRTSFILLPPAISILVIIRYRKHYSSILTNEMANIVNNYMKISLIKVIYNSTAYIFLFVVLKCILIL